MSLKYNPDAPVDLQPDDFSCSEQSAEWLLRAIGRNPGDAWIRGQLLSNGLMTERYGLMDASGAALAAWLQREYGDEMGLTFTSKNGATWEDVTAIAGKQPMMLGGRGWHHWTGVRRLQAGGLELANPAPNWKDVGLLLDRDEFNRLGGWSYITVAGTEAASPGDLTDEPDHAFTLADLWPTIRAAGAEFGFDPQVLAGMMKQEGEFKNWRVHHDGTGHGLLGLDDNGLLPDFERWSGLSIGRGQSAASIPIVPQIRYAASALADYANRLGGPYAAARAWHRGERLMNDARGIGYEGLIRAHVLAIFGSNETPVPSDEIDRLLATIRESAARLAELARQ